ncbi:MAG: hypothetical protein EBV19_05085 [Flavobacteriia bacterium]|nr:hypothetical protein [Flavobacteriia bacterium]
MNNIELFLLDIGFSFTAARWFPHILMVLFGTGLFFLVIKASNLRKWMKWTLAILLLVQSELFYFWLFPLAKGDLSDSGVSVKTALKFPKARKLYIIADPGCKHCINSTRDMREFVEYTQTPIEYMLITSDTSEMYFFQNLVGDKITCSLSPNLVESIKLTEGFFPTYVLVENGKVVKRWKNDIFGTRAMDLIDRQE